MKDFTKVERVYRWGLLLAVFLLFGINLMLANPLTPNGVVCVADSEQVVPAGVPADVYWFFKNHYNMEVTPEDNIPLFSLIKRWHRTPYRYAGTSKQGVDCSGFVCIAYDSLYGYKLPRDAGSQYAVCYGVKKKHDFQQGDLVFFKRGRHYISHVGIYLKDNKFVHSASIFGVIISNLDEQYYRHHYFSGGRVNDDLIPIIPHKPIEPLWVEKPCYDYESVRAFFKAQNKEPKVYPCEYEIEFVPLAHIPTASIMKEGRMRLVRSDYRTLSILASALNYARLNETIQTHEQKLNADPKAHRLSWSPVVNSTIRTCHKVASLFSPRGRYVFTFKDKIPNPKYKYSADVGKNRSDGL